MIGQRFGRGLAAFLMSCPPVASSAQNATAQTVARDSATAVSTVAFGPALLLTRLIAPGPKFGAGATHRFFLGDEYRDLWTTPIRVPELDLKTFAGGLHATKTGGGMQTKSLRLATTDGLEYAFREVRKGHSFSFPPQYEGSFVEWMSKDQRAALHPAGAIVAASLMAAVGVLHPTPTLVVMPENADLGEFGEEFAGKLGLLVEFPKKPKKGVAFAGAAKIIDSDELLTLINADPKEQVDAAALLAARLMDFLFGDWDRHPGQWKWARMKSDSGGATPWLPIARDRDMAFASYEGVFGKTAAYVSGISKPFDATFNVKGLTQNAIAMDRRLLGNLSRTVWDSVVRVVSARITDPAIDSAVWALPGEYRSSGAKLAVILKQRRAGLHGAADKFYAQIFSWVDLHATDKSDVASITRIDNRFVDIRLASHKSGEYFSRRYDSDETNEIRLYLHGGDDSALVTGRVAHSIPIRVIGGGGDNTLVDSSTVGASREWTSIYDAGRGADETFGDDTLFNRRPRMRERGKLQEGQRDFGTKIVPIFGFSDPRGLGPTAKIGLTRYRYGFRRRPYDTRLVAQAEYAMQSAGWRIGADYDQRLESSAWHFSAGARMSQFEVINYFGLGNATPDAGLLSDYFNARQRQWFFRPAVGFALNTTSDLSIGPVVQYSTTDDKPGHFVSTAKPYGFGDFRQAGVQVVLHHDFRDGEADSPHRIVYDIVGGAFPAFWDVKTPFAKLNATVAASIPFDAPTQPFLILRAGGKKLWGVFPFSEAAFIGGERTTRYMESQRYAGDAALFATSELRLHVASFTFLPLATGIVGVAEAGRVFVDGKSPDGWHSVTGGGVWVGLKESPTALTLLLTNERGRSGVHIKIGLGF